MYAFNLIGGVLSALITYFAMFYAGKVADGFQNKERGDLWAPVAFGTALGAYFFFFAYNMQNGFFTSLGLCLLTAIGGAWTILAIAWLFCKTVDHLLNFGERLKRWSRKATRMIDDHLIPHRKTNNNVRQNKTK